MKVQSPKSHLLRFAPPPRTVYPRFESIAGPNFQYLLHVLGFSLFPILFLAWLALTLAWGALGKNVGGRFTYTLIIDNPTSMHDQMQVEYRLRNLPHVLPVTLSQTQLHQLGMPQGPIGHPGRPLLTATVPVRVLQIGSWPYAHAIFPWTSIWRRAIPPLLLTIISTLALLILHGDLFQTLRRSFSLVKHGVPTEGSFLGFHETGWWEPSLEYRWTYIRRCYVDYAFLGPEGREYRGCQLAMGAIDPALLSDESHIIVLHDPANPRQHVMYAACAFCTPTT